MSEMKDLLSRVILLDVDNRRAFDLTVAHSNLTESAKSADIITSIEIIRNEIAYNLLQVIASGELSFAEHAANSLFKLQYIQAEPSEELYRRLFPEQENKQAVYPFQQVK